MNHNLLYTDADLLQFKNYVNANSFTLMAFDLETDSVEEVKANVYGIGIAFDEEESFYIPIRKKTGELWWDNDPVPYIKELLNQYSLLGHNIIYDALVWKHNFKQDIVKNITDDTILIKHLIDEEQPFGLKEVAVKYLGPWADKAQQKMIDNIKANGGSATKTNMQMYLCDTEVLGEYCCFKPKSSLVSLANGAAKYIEDVVIGDKVITHTGKIKPVLSSFSNQYEGQVYFLELENGRMVKGATAEHPFLILNQDDNTLTWKKIKDIKVNDLLVKGKYKEEVYSNLNYSDDFWWLFGFYQAEGHISKRKNNEYLVFSIHQKEVQKVTEVLQKLNYKYSLCKDKRSLGCQITICNNEISALFKQLSSGKFKSWEKQVSTEVFNYLSLNRPACLNFLAGYFDGDGNYRQLKNKSIQLRAASVSYSLINTLDLLSTKHSLNCSRRDYSATGTRRHRYELVFFTQSANTIMSCSKFKPYVGEIVEESFKNYVRVLNKKTEQYKGLVYNISVLGDESYISNGIVSHNCWDVLLTYKLYNLFKPMLKEQELETLYKEEVMPLYREVTIPMKERGINIDVGYFQNLQQTIQTDILKLEETLIETIAPLIENFQTELLTAKAPVKKTGSFPKHVASVLKETLPSSLAKKELEKHRTLSTVMWMLGDTELDEETILKAQLSMFFDKYPEQNYVFNLRSRDHLKGLFFDTLQEDALSETETGQPQIDDNFLESVSKKYSWVATLQDFNKLEKLKGTYIDGILDRQVEGIIYTSMLQFGTTSGRYASRNPNLQNAPRPKEEDSGLSELVLKYTNAIRGGFVAPRGYKFVDADYSALEPRCFCESSGDANLIAIFKSGEDFYSSIAKKVFNLKDVSTYKKDPNFLGKLYPEKRQIIKALALATTYGAEAYRISDLLKISKDEAQTLIDDYLNAYPGLKSYISNCHYEASHKGFVRTAFGRIRHLPAAKEIYKAYGNNILDPRWAKGKGLSEQRRLYKNKLNNSTNVKIQGLAAHIINRAMININREFAKNNIDGWVTLMIHDQVVCSVKEDQAATALKIVKHCMENVVTLAVPLVAEPKIADNLKDSH